MEVGKLKNEMLGEIVLSELKEVRDDILIRPGVGEDCAAIAFGDLACVLTTDPITGSGSHLGRLAVHVCLNDIASSGAEPVGLLLTLLCPQQTTQLEIQGILREANETANAMGIEIVGGHTEITTAVNRTIVSATAIGKTSIKSLVKTSGAKPGDLIYITKQAATEGTAIIAHDKESELSDHLSKEDLEFAKSLIEAISVVPEGKIAARAGASAMHDATEGGILGAVHELCEASGTGCLIDYEKINIQEVTKKICDFYKINPLKLISSGSMVICISDKVALNMERDLKAANISFACIGKITEDPDKIICFASETESRCEMIESPEADELYKVIS
jgi:hydrogenase maturation factor